MTPERPSWRKTEIDVGKEYSAYDAKIHLRMESEFHMEPKAVRVPNIIKQDIALKRKTIILKKEVGRTT